MDSQVLREQLIHSLKGGLAYNPLRDVLGNFPEDKINKNIPGIEYTPYQLMEHIRIAQWDILEFTKNQKHVSPDWPEGYWPDKTVKANRDDWDKTVKQFFTDLTEIENIVNNQELDLTTVLPENDAYNYLREVMLVIVHNSYHLGQLVLFSKSK